jgi:hypothetical protein
MRHIFAASTKLLAFFTEYYRFARLKIICLQENHDFLYLRTVSLGQVLDCASYDYAIVAQKAAAEIITQLFNNAFDREFGIAERCSGPFKSAERATR